MQQPSKLSLMSESLEDISHSHALDQDLRSVILYLPTFHFIHRLEQTNILVNLWQQVDNSFVEIQSISSDIMTKNSSGPGHTFTIHHVSPITKSFGPLESLVQDVSLRFLTVRRWSLGAPKNIFQAKELFHYVTILLFFCHLRSSGRC
jgi:hypothetical protein